ncbi:hypothetical protein LMG31506_02611 [Cupriavidus yeoncheonensis]|uniref:DUF2325 domain-containing protein n=1 Tax=Cupriavidus yeoncheonensis TaxID=1462994 RepID=A0A916IU46_9BURK|nr:DUF2325 domain-containing protein [Cupriavidus yeoncheonensis]CAG2142109.1 hypothetical protein LMG31506_02611 [Cupriavidus yeoncheonensis]
MHSPPFRLARTHLLAVSRPALADPGCCTGQQAAPGPAARRRATLADLEPRFHCSLIGTCLGTAELRKLVMRLSATDRNAGDLEIHHEAVTLATRGGAPCKTLNKALDERHALAVRRFGAARDVATLQTMWEQALAGGDIPGAYWALMTHPHATPALRQAAFGEVHMLSHLVGAANRADIRRLVALEAENEALKDKIGRQQQRMRQMSTEHAAGQRELAGQMARLQAMQCAAPAAGDADVASLRSTLRAREENIATQASRITALEQRALSSREEAQALRDTLEAVHAQLASSQAEILALEALLSAPSGHDGAPAPAIAALAGKRIVYVGGRPGSNHALRDWIEAAGGSFLDHDGGVEDRKGLLPAMVAGADIVVFPVDCVDHDSVARVKRECQRHSVAYHPVRSASVASFVELATRLFGMPAGTGQA